MERYRLLPAPSIRMPVTMSDTFSNDEICALRVSEYQPFKLRGISAVEYEVNDGFEAGYFNLRRIEISSCHYHPPGIK